MAKKNLIPKSTAENAYELLAEVKALILEEPKRFNQSWWRSIRTRVRSRPYFADAEFPACGTVCCVAGWVATLRGGAHSQSIGFTAAKLLGIDGFSAGQLFSQSALIGLGTGWPLPRQGTRAYARLGAKHISNFMQTHAAQLKARVLPRLPKAVR